ncbi:hypothetical protein LINPERPRIM_LOCUS578 [Linum perenne]
MEKLPSFLERSIYQRGSRRSNKNVRSGSITRPLNMACIFKCRRI